MAATYYVATGGSDAANGLSPGTAWATISKVNAHSFVAGDAVLFNGGNIFSGGIVLTTSGSAGNLITFSSYGAGVATISSVAGTSGFSAHNCGYIVVQNINFTGPGIATANVDGISFFVDSASTIFQSVQVTNCTVTGYANAISILGKATSSGYNNPRITDCIAHDNVNGIIIHSPGVNTLYAHTNAYIGYCTSYNNPGNVALSGIGGWQGSGIFLGFTNGGTIEFCESYGNGAQNANVGGGPVGIWIANSNAVTMQFCESHHNSTTSANQDGGGFDMDGGSSSCTTQYCYSHNNKGYGFLLYQYPAEPTAWVSNILRYCISENDGSGIELGGESGYNITNSSVYNNTIYNSVGTLVKFYSGYMTGITITNNIFFSASNQVLVSLASGIGTPGVTFSYNDYFASGTFQISWLGTTYTSLVSWGQDSTGLTSNPLLTNPGNGGTVGDPTILPNLSAYRLQVGSPMIDSGATITSPGAIDFYRAPIPYGSGYDIGAHEFTVGVLSGPGPYIDPLLITKPSEWLYFGAVSQWKYPSRAYLETMPASVFLNGVGINISNEQVNPMLVAEMLSKHGFTRARIEIGWGSLDYTTETVPSNAPGMAQVQACAAFGIRPIIVLNGNQGIPCPNITLNHSITVAAAANATTITLDSTGDIVPGYSGFFLSAYTGSYTMNDPLVVSVAGNVVTLSHGLYTSLPTGPIGMNTFKYRPFDVAGDPYYNATEQAATIAGWQTYARAVATAVGAIMGSIGFDLEIWNEVTFGSQFLFLPLYYNASQSALPDLVTPIANTATANPTLFSGVVIEDGLFSNESPFAASSTEPARIGAIGKHPYPVITSYPAGQQGSSMLNDQYGYDSAPFPFVPTYSEYFPEYSGTCLQTETIIRDMSPTTNSVSGVDHGRFARPGNPCTVFITETGIAPNQVGISDSPTALLMKAKGAARNFCFFLNKGAAMVDLFAATDSGGDLGFQILLQSFVDNIVTPNAPYPNPDTPYLSPALKCVGNIVSAMQANLATITTPRSLGVFGISDIHGHCQFGGDATLAHRNGYDREAFQFLPLQVNNNRFAIPYYVMTRNLVNPLTPEQFTVGISGVNGTISAVSAYDPLNNVSVSVATRSVNSSSITLTLTAADYPYILIIDDSPSGNITHSTGSLIPEYMLLGLYS